MKILATVSAALLALVLSACGGGIGSQVPHRDTLTYSGSTTLTVGAAMSLSPSVSGSDTITGWSVSPSLPAGLSLDSTSGMIAGTPTAVTPAGNYTVMASYRGGSASTTLMIVVNDRPPTISYGLKAVTYAANSQIPTLGPSVAGGAVVNWSVSPALPPGLKLSATTGAISGTPTTPGPAAVYTITGENSGGSSSFDLTIEVGTLLLDLGNQGSIQGLRMTSSRVVSLDNRGLWVLWDYTTGKEIASGSASCPVTDYSRNNTPACINRGSPSRSFDLPLPPFMDLEGPTLAVETTAGVEVYSSADGSLSTLITTPIAWAAVATDGSYICGGSTTGLTVWSPSGTVIASLAGDYSSALVFPSPGQIQVAMGPAGKDVIETVALPAGTPTVSQPFLGQFDSWFLDGQRFLTSTGDQVWVYSSATVQQLDSAMLASVDGLAGDGTWFWSIVNGGTQLNVYKVGASSSPAASYPVNESTGSIVPSGSTIGILDSGYGTGAVVDLSGASPTSATFNTPVAYLSAYAAVSPSQWVVGNSHGALFDGASLGATPRHFGYGTAWSIAGGGQTLAIATAIGQVLYFDASTLQQQGSIAFPATELALSSDGSILSAAGDLQDSQYAPTEALNVYSMPAGTLTYAWPYTVGGTPALVDFTLSGSGTVLGQVVYSNSTCLRQVTATTGGPVLWSDTNSAACEPARDPAQMAIRLSPDGTWVAVSEAPIPETQAGTYPTTNLYQNGSLVATVQGLVVAWLDASHILVNNYAYSSTQVAWSYVNSTVYDTSGNKVTDLQLPLGLGSLQAVSPDSIYSPDTNAIYSTTTGKATWTGGQSFGPGAVAGTYVVAVYGSQVIATQF